MQGAGAFGEQVEDFAVAAQDRGVSWPGGGELGIDGGEEFQQVPGAGSGGVDALLVVAECLQGQLEVALLFVVADFGQQPGLGAAGAGVERRSGFR